ncbi:MAG TPA: PilN domain-containing protein [Candidatus Andersenbacteria bacterium]|nr:PilN domain-containing protein [Candidatus Andersenbacteria bacterium]
MASINLAPGTEYIIAARKRRQRLYIISICIVAIFGIGFGVLFFMGQSLTSQNEALKKSIQEADANIQASQADALRVSLFEKRLTQTKTLLDNHVKWDQVFADIERLLPPSAVLTGMDAGTDSSTITVEGVTPDIDAVAQTIASLSAGQNHSSFFSNGTVKEVTKGDQNASDQSKTGYNFIITLTIDPAKLQAASAQ